MPMRKSTLLWLTLTVICGAALFRTSQKVHDGTEKLAALNSSISREEESLRVLRTEWSYLNQPARLEKLARAHLNLAPLSARQFVRAEDLPLRGQAAAEEKAGEKTPAAAPETAAAPVLKVIPPKAAPAKAAPVKAIAPKAPTSVAGTRSFSDVMKSLKAGVE